MEHMEPRLRAFWIIHLIALGIFGLEFLFVLSIWLRGRVPGLPVKASWAAKLWAVVKGTVRTIFSRRLWVALKALVVDGLIHIPLMKKNTFRWIAHISTFGSFLLLGILSTITGIAVELLHPDHGLIAHGTGIRSFDAIIKVLIDFDHPFTAFSNELLGLIFFFGLCLLFFRRFIKKDAQLRTIAADKIVMSALFAISITGFPLEAFRLLAKQPFSSTAGWGFIGYPLALLMQPLNWNWEAWHNVLFWIHFAIVTALMYYMPFSKFFHTVMSPVVAVLSQLEREDHRHRRPHEPASSPADAP
ncbi:MAG: respiratory nitrate reductase subunit gamma [Anaerolineae bacterium]|nr:MAG: respiratory nitrate reductase subunit gamma [Anaerolineae bacterium]